MRASLLGAANTLLAYPTPPEIRASELPVQTAHIASPRGSLTVVPALLTIDGTVLTAPLSAYYGAALTWSVL